MWIATPRWCVATRLLHVGSDIGSQVSRGCQRDRPVAATCEDRTEARRADRSGWAPGSSSTQTLWPASRGLLLQGRGQSGCRDRRWAWCPVRAQPVVRGQAGLPGATARATADGGTETSGIADVGRLGGAVNAHRQHVAAGAVHHGAGGRTEQPADAAVAMGAHYDQVRMQALRL